MLNFNQRLYLTLLIKDIDFKTLAGKLRVSENKLTERIKHNYEWGLMDLTVLADLNIDLNRLFASDIRTDKCLAIELENKALREKIKKIKQLSALFSYLTPGRER